MYFPSVDTQRQTVNYRRAAVATSGRNEVFHRRPWQEAGLVSISPARRAASAERNYTVSSDAQHATEGIAVSGDVRYWMSVSELASVRQAG